MRLKKLYLLLLVLIFICHDLYNSNQVEANEISLTVPKVKIQTINDDTAIKITVFKNMNADGFEIYVLEEDTIYSGYKNITKFYKKIAEIEKSGSSKRVIRINSLCPGSYKFKVRAYNYKNGEIMLYSDFTKERTVRLNDTKKREDSLYTYDFSDVKKGDIIKFGAYEQDGNFSNGKEAIEWVVIEKSKNQLFLLSKYVLDCLPYNKEYMPITWENSTVRKWLNEYFYLGSFNEVEKGMIKNTLLKSPNNSLCGNDTQDHIFLLSFVDVIESSFGFNPAFEVDDINRRCSPTVYAKIQGVCSRPPQKVFIDGLIGDDSFLTKDGENPCCWWLRNPGEYLDLGVYLRNGGGPVSRASIVWRDGSLIDEMGDSVSSTAYGVRPAMYISIKAK